MQLKLLSILALASTTLANQLPFGTDPINLHKLPTEFPPTTSVNVASTETIRNTLALYPFAIDGRNFDALSNVFAPDAVANYSAPLNVLTPLSNIQDGLRTSLACVTTQHHFGTQLIDIASPDIAQSITYYRAAHFGTAPNMTDQVVYAYGQYQDTWNRQADGTWRIVYRNLVYMVGFALFLPLEVVLSNSY